MPEPIDRAQVPEHHRWDHASLFPDLDAFDASFRSVEERLDEVRSFAGTLTVEGGPTRLAEWLATIESIERDLGRLRVWAAMASSVDSDDEPARERSDRLSSLAAHLAEASAFATPELLALPPGTLRAWIRDPALPDRERWLERLERDAPHRRSAEVEALLGALGTPFDGARTTHGLLANAELDVRPARDGDGVEHAVTQAVVSVLKASPDRTLRQNAFTAYADAHLARQRTMASLLVTGARQTNLLARTRGYQDALAMTLGPLEVPREVVETLLERYQANLGVWHRWFELKRRHLGLKRLQPWDVDAPVSPAPPHVGYGEAVGWLATALAPMGDEYVSTMQRGALEDRWVDRVPNASKRMGAFSTSWGGSKPYIMMSWTDDLSSASTLAHELGHSMHSNLAWASQPYPYARYTLFAAEVASNLHQAMMREHLFTERAGDREFELALIDEAMENFGRYFLIMPTLMRFELELHRRAEAGESLSATALNELLAGNLAEAYGPAMEPLDERVGITWAQFHTHLYSRFYVFMYATGIAGAHAFARRMLDGVSGATESYLAFLREGGRSAPIEAMRRAGVDLASQQPVDDAFAVLSSHVDRFEALMDHSS